MPAFRLSTNVIPVHYVLDLATDVTKPGFTGHVEISVVTTTPTRVFYLHAGKNLTIPTVRVSVAGKEDIPAVIDRAPSYIVDAAECIVQVTCDRFIVGETSVFMTFHAPYSSAACGLYVSMWNGVRTLATQMQATSARDVFPCFDEPALKARFAVTVHATFPSGVEGADPLPWQVLSNMPVLRRESGSRLTTTHVFETTPPMSTYLLAVVVAPLFSKTTVVSWKDGRSTDVSVWCYPNDENLVDLPLRFAVAALQDLTSIFDIPYPLAKLDLVPVFDFDAGAMENWGLITFRAALLNANTSTPRSQLYEVFVTIAHELAHQWFGNLVTMAWWDEIWLNESFATFTAAWTCSRVFANDVGYGFTSDDAWITFVCNEMTEALTMDALPSTRPIVPDPAFITVSSDVEQLFDSKAYAKGAMVLRMLATLLGLDVFAKGLHEYLTSRRWETATAQDLWDALTRVSSVDVCAFMTPWLHTRGFPVVRVDVAGNVLQTPFHDVDTGVSWPLLVRTTALAVPELLPYPYISYVVSSSTEHPLFQAAQFKIAEASDRLYPMWYFNVGCLLAAVHGSFEECLAPVACAPDDFLALSLTYLSKILSLRVRVQHGLDPPSRAAVSFLVDVAATSSIHARVRHAALDVTAEWDDMCRTCGKKGLRVQEQDGIRVNDDNDSELYDLVRQAALSDVAYSTLKKLAVDAEPSVLRALASVDGSRRLLATLRWGMQSDHVRPTNFLYLLTSVNDGHADARDAWLRRNWQVIANSQGKHGMEQILSVVLQGVATSKSYEAWKRFLAETYTTAATEDMLHETAARLLLAHELVQRACSDADI